MNNVGLESLLLIVLDAHDNCFEFRASESDSSEIRFRRAAYLLAILDSPGH